MQDSKQTFSLSRAPAAASFSLTTPTIPVAQTAITIAVDVDFIATLPAGQNAAGKGIYMMDNRLLNKSSNEGGLELSTRCPTGNLISFTAVPIRSGPDVKVEIVGFNVSNGSVFTAAGQPRPFNPPPGGGSTNSFWMGQAMSQGAQTYQIQINVQIGALQPVSHFISWDPFITAQ